VLSGGAAKIRCGGGKVGSTIAEKILGAHSGGRAVRAGEVVVARIDFAMIHDARAANALKMIARLGAKSLPF